MNVSEPRIADFLQRLRLYLKEERVVVDVYALDRASMELEWDHLAILDELRWLTVSAFHRVEIGRDPRYSGEKIWVFCPEIDLPPVFKPSNLWIRLIERRGMIVISFHEA